MSKQDSFIGTSVKHAIQPGAVVRFGLLQDGDYFYHPDRDGALYHKSRPAIVYANPRYNTINADYKVESVADDTIVMAKAAYQPRNDFPAGQFIRFGDLQNGDEFIIQDVTYRKRTDWYEFNAPGTQGSRLVKSSAKAINEAVMYPNFKDDDIVIFERDATEDQPKYYWIWQTD
jgi:hypothetical protein